MVLNTFALTGGIGSGKSTVGARFAARGVPVVDADALARVVVAAGAPALADIVQAFGPEVLQKDGELDRKALARRVFSDQEARARLEAITHPRIRALALSQFAELSERGTALACYEVPLLFEAGLDREYGPVVVVTAPVSDQIARTMRRDELPRPHVEARLRAQLPLEQKARRADYVIDNSSAVEVTFEQADAVLDSLCRTFGLDPARYPRPVLTKSPPPALPQQ